MEYIFVHGLSGWGSYDKAYERMPYWGMRGGDLMTFLREKGYSCHAASVSPSGSAWDRACELYGQIAGSRVDYGALHSRKHGHERFGRDFSDCPLIEKWGDDTRIVLLGHSFGGATIRLFSELLANGDPEEARESGSPFFKGGMAKRIHSIVTLASPMNGTTAYDLYEDPSFNSENVRVPWWSKVFARMMSKGLKSKESQLDPTDTAAYDMHIDNALVMNGRIRTLSHVYYFSVPFSFTRMGKDGNHRPRKGMEPLFTMRSYHIGAYTGKTRGGIEIDGSWRQNDGLVNTVSAMVPTGAPSKPLDRSDVKAGLWNVFPVVEGDHMWPQGGLMRRHDIRAFYADILGLIDSL